MEEERRARIEREAYESKQREVMK